MFIIGIYLLLWLPCAVALGKFTNSHSTEDWAGSVIGGLCWPIIVLIVLFFGLVFGIGAALRELFG